MIVCVLGNCIGPMFGLFAGAVIAVTVIIIALAVEQVKRERKDGK